MIKMKYKYILFDWDGTLAMTLTLWLESYKNSLQLYDVHLSDKQIAREAFGDWQAAVKFGVTDSEAFNNNLKEKVTGNYATTDLYEGVKETLIELHDHDMKLGVLSTSLKHLIEGSLRHHKINDMFDIIIAGDDVMHHKPDPEGIHLAISAFGADKKEVVMVGDSRSDLGAAQNAGVDSILFHPSHNEFFYELEDLRRYEPTHLVRNFSDIKSILL